jgi:ribosomal protein S18 acetylase RimI-like enzyme
MTQALHVRTAQARDDDAIWSIIGPTIAAGETYPLPRDMSRSDALAYWKSPGHQVFVAEAEGRVVGTYYLKPNQQGGGAHVANCGYITAEAARGRGVARAMCLHSLDQARVQNFLALQFNFVVSSNTRAVRLWQSLGFAIVGTLPQAFRHPQLGLVDALVMYRRL